MNVVQAMSQPDWLEALPNVSVATAQRPADLEALISKGEPALIKGAIGHWPALAVSNQGPAALNDYLLERDGGAAVPVMEAPPSTGGRFGYAADPREFTFTKRNRPLRETFDRITRSQDQPPAAAYVAIQMLPLDVQMPAFVRDNAMPLVPAGASVRLWLGGPVKTQIHNDRDHNLACVIAGHRRFILFPPEQVANLYIGPLDNPPPLSLVDPEDPDLLHFPRFHDAMAAARVAYLSPGDALLMPRYWWHHVTSFDPYNAMVNYWWGDAAPGLGNPHDAFLTAILAFKDLPDADRAYWHAMFETYVFGEDGAAHLPPQARGMLGKLSSQQRASLRQRLKAAILKS